MVLLPCIDRLVVLLGDVADSVPLLLLGRGVEAFYIRVEILQCVGEFDSFGKGDVLVRAAFPLDFGAVDACDELLQDLLLQVAIEATVFSEGPQACSEFHC